MNKIDEMLERLCPEGIDFVKLGEVCEINRGVRVVKKDLHKVGPFPVYQNSMIPLGYSFNSNYPADTTFVISAGSAGEVGYSSVDFWAADDCLCITCPKYISNKFVYYNLVNKQYLLKSKVRKASVPRLSRSAVEKIEIPLPPIEVQNEIVRILDKFASLAAELQAELQARQKQYEYYRDKLLIFAKIGGGTQGVTWMRMSEIGCFFGGLSGKSKADFGNGNCKYITYMNVYNNLETDLNTNDLVSIGSDEKQNKLALGDVLFTGSSETPEECGMSSVICKEPPEILYLNSFCFGYRLNDTTMFNPHFAKHLYRCNQMRKQIIKTANGVTRFNVSKKKFGNIMIPVISIEEQERIAAILDRFERLTTDLQAGLPAEIKARQQQYEYYRERLLTFKRKTA